MSTSTKAQHQHTIYQKERDEKTVKILTPLELLKAIDDFWAGWPIYSATPLSPVAYITEEDQPIADMIRRTLRQIKKARGE